MSPHGKTFAPSKQHTSPPVKSPPAWFGADFFNHLFILAFGACGRTPLRQRQRMRPLRPKRGVSSESNQRVLATTTADG